MKRVVLGVFIGAVTATGVRAAQDSYERVSDNPFAPEYRPIDERHRNDTAWKPTPGDPFGEFYTRGKLPKRKLPVNPKKPSASTLSTKGSNPIKDETVPINSVVDRSADRRFYQPPVDPAETDQPFMQKEPDSEDRKFDSEGVEIPQPKTEGAQARETQLRNKLREEIYSEYYEQQKQAKNAPAQPTITPLWPRTKKWAEDQWESASKLTDYVVKNPLKSAAFAGIAFLTVYGVVTAGTALYRKIFGSKSK